MMIELVCTTSGKHNTIRSEQALLLLGTTRMALLMDEE
jgi:hypothetical protein